jgi:hypothetical protein
MITTRGRFLGALAVGVVAEEAGEDDVAIGAQSRGGDEERAPFMAHHEP